jgi:hypothetical protein
MQKLEALFRSSGNSEFIPKEKALEIASQIDKEREKTQELLRKLEKWVGMTLKEEIEIHLSEMNGTTFNPISFHYDRLNGDQ